MCSFITSLFKNKINIYEALLEKTSHITFYKKKLELEEF